MIAPESRLAAVALVATLMFPAPAAGTDAPGTRVSDHLTVEEVRDGVWVHTSWHTLEGGRAFPGNGLIVRSGDGVVLVDTAWGAGITDELLAWIEEGLGLPVVGAIVTHHHDDSVGGVPSLAAQGIPAWAHPGTRALAPPAVAAQLQTFDDLGAGDATTVLGLEVFYPGPGHAHDNVVVWVPRANVVFGGCLVRSPEFPGAGNTADADLAGWPVAALRVRDRYDDAALVVPGHGSAGDISLLTHTADLFPVQR